MAPARAVGVLALVVLLAGCAPRYVEPAAAQPAAELHIVTDRQSFATGQGFAAPECHARVIDLETSTAPPTFVVHPLKPSCQLR